MDQIQGLKERDVKYNPRGFLFCFLEHLGENTKVGVLSVGE